MFSRRVYRQSGIGGCLHTRLSCRSRGFHAQADAKLVLNQLEAPLLPRVIPPPHAVVRNEDRPANCRLAVLDALRGQTLKIPDLVRAVYPDWNVEVDGKLAQIRDSVEPKFVSRWCSRVEQGVKLRRGDLAMAAAFFWTGSKLERLRPLTEFMYWAFLWDDEIDDGDLRYSRRGAKQYCNDTIAMLRWSLEPESRGLPRPVARGEHNTTCFESIGRDMQAGQSTDALRRFANSLCNFVTAVCTSQTQRLETISSWSQYMDCREHTGGVYPCLMAMEFAYDLDVPSWVYEHEATKIMFKEAAFSFSIVNDIVSLKKEVVENQVDSIIPLKMHLAGYKDVNVAMDEATQDLIDSRADFDAATLRLYNSLAYRQLSDAAQADVEMLVQGCKNVMVGNVKWSLSNDRYLRQEWRNGWGATVEL